MAGTLVSGMGRPELRLWAGQGAGGGRSWSGIKISLYHARRFGKREAPLPAPGIREEPETGPGVGQRLTVVLIVAVQAILVGLKVQVTQTSKQILPTPKGPLKQVR